MAACGIWRIRSRLVAVVVDDDGKAAATLHAEANDQESWALLENVDGIHGLDCAVVVADDLLKTDEAICRFALVRGHDLWAAPRPLIEAIRLAAGLATSARVAAMLARLAILPGFRGHLRRVDRNSQDSRQLPLL
jgi:hypothetical protein